MSFNPADYHPDWKSIVRQINDQAGNRWRPRPRSAGKEGPMSELVIEYQSAHEPGRYLIEVIRCPDCDGQGGIPLQWSKTFCERCQGTGRLGHISDGPGYLDSEIVQAVAALRGDGGA